MTIEEFSYGDVHEEVTAEEFWGEDEEDNSDNDIDTSSEEVEVEEPTEEKEGEDISEDSEQRRVDGSGDEKEESSEQEDETDEEEKLPDPPIIPPSFLKEEEKGEFAELPRKMQEAMLRVVTPMQAEFSRKSQELASLSREKQEYDSVFAEIDPHLKENGRTRADYVKGLVEGDYLASNNPEAFLLNFAVNSGINLPDLIRQVHSGEFSRLNETKEVELENARLRTQEAARRNREAEYQRNQEFQQNAQAINQRIDSLKAQRSENGHLLYPFFPYVESQMEKMWEQTAASMNGASFEQIFDVVYKAAENTNPSIISYKENQEKKAKASRIASKAKQQKQVQRKLAQNSSRASRVVNSNEDFSYSNINFD